jgi:hypothetical protein
MKLQIRVSNQTINVNVNNMLTMNLDVTEMQSFVKELSLIAKMFGQTIEEEQLLLITNIIKAYVSMLERAEGATTFEYNTENNDVTVTSNSKCTFNVPEMIHMFKQLIELNN